MITFLTTLSCIVVEIFVYIGLFISAYKIPRLFLSHYVKKHDMTLNELLNENDPLCDLSSSLDELNYFLMVFIVGSILTVFNDLSKFSLSEILVSLLFINFIILIVADIVVLIDLNDCLKRIDKRLHKQLVKQSIKI